MLKANLYGHVNWIIEYKIEIKYYPIYCYKNVEDKNLTTNYRMKCAHGRNS